MQAHRIDPMEVHERMKAGQPVSFIDTRGPADWERSDEQLPGARRLPVDQIADHLSELPRGHTIITYCA